MISFSAAVACAWCGGRLRKAGPRFPPVSLARRSIRRSRASGCAAATGLPGRFYRICRCMPLARRAAHCRFHRGLLTGGDSCRLWAASRPRWRHLMRSSDTSTSGRPRAACTTFGQPLVGAISSPTVAACRLTDSCHGRSRRHEMEQITASRIPARGHMSSGTCRWVSRRPWR